MNIYELLFGSVSALCFSVSKTKDKVEIGIDKYQMIIGQ
jgi:hypothetical protein